MGARDGIVSILNGGKVKATAASGLVSEMAVGTTEADADISRRHVVGVRRRKSHGWSSGDVEGGGGGGSCNGGRDRTLKSPAEINKKL